MKISVKRYYIFVDSINIKIKYYNSLQELLRCCKEYIEEVKRKEKDKYIGIGAEFIDEKDEVGAIDFISRKGQDNFNWSNDVEKLNIDVPKDFKDVLDELIKIL